ncbi:MAG TPA: DUF1648 domain-containing protein [Coriobacteriia bacterium]
MSDRDPREQVPTAPMPDELPAPPRLRDYTKLPLLLIAAMFVAGAVVYSRLPASIPMHWGISGAPDSFWPKSFGSVFFMPLMSLGLYALLVVVPFLDPRRRSLKLSFRAYNILIDAIVGLEAVIFAATLIAAFNNGFDVAKVVLISVGLLFAVIGNYMTTVKQNWTFGVRVSWTLSDEVVWRKTNRLGGYLFVVAGALTIVSAFLPGPWAFGLMMSAILGILVITYVYSYLLFRSRHPEA